MTSFDIIEDLALVGVDDYKLLKLYNQSEEGFKNWCDSFLIKAIPNFYQCRQNLDYDLTNREFLSDLTNLEISILADLWVIEWMLREVQNSAQIQNKLQTSGGFKNHSSAQNLKEKSSYLDGMREKVRQKITEYQLQDISDILI